MKVNLSKKGFTLVELMIVLGVIALLLGVILLSARGTQTAAKITGTTTEIQQIYGACQTWIGNGRTSYTGLTIATLQGIGYIPATLKSPWAGTFTVAVNGTDSSRVNISLTAVPSEPVHGEIAAALGQNLFSNSYNASTSTSTFTF